MVQAPRDISRVITACRMGFAGFATPETSKDALVDLPRRDLTRASRYCSHRQGFRSPFGEHTGTNGTPYGPLADLSLR